MPRVSAFYDIVIYIYVRDHGVAHLHARYGGDEVVIAIATGEVLAGGLPGRQLGQVHEWIELHRIELLAAWQRACHGETPGTIEPLP